MDVVQQVIHMNNGEGDTSYANNSRRQKTILIKMKPVIKEAIQDLCTTTSMPETICIGDLGCASGPNAFLAISMILDAIYERCMEVGGSPPELQLFWNDLPGNDFNSVFNSLPAFYDRFREDKGDHEFRPCFVFGAPGSFYGRLFARRSLHFVCCSMAVHWLSQVPPGLGNSNKGNVMCGKTSPLSAYKAYAEQFRRDFTSFLKTRSQEMIPGGRMFLTMKSRTTEDRFNSERCPSTNDVSEILNKMVSMGLIEEGKLDTFNIPFYEPNIGEVRDIIEKEGSFRINQIEENQVIFSTGNVAKAAANDARAVSESLFRSHFGDGINIDKLFEMLEEDLSLKLAAEGLYVTDYLVVSTTRRE